MGKILIIIILLFCLVPKINGADLLPKNHAIYDFSIKTPLGGSPAKEVIKQIKKQVNDIVVIQKSLNNITIEVAINKKTSIYEVMKIVKNAINKDKEVKRKYGTDGLMILRDFSEGREKKKVYSIIINTNNSPLPARLFDRTLRTNSSKKEQ